MVSLPNCDWRRLSVQAGFRVLFGETTRHCAHLELAALAGVLASVGVSSGYAEQLDFAVRCVLKLLRQRFSIVTAHTITLDVWDGWGRDRNLMGTLADYLGKYAAAVNVHLGDYRERLGREDQARVDHLLLLPPLPKQFRQRFVPSAERRVEVRRLYAGNVGIHYPDVEATRWPMKLNCVSRLKCRRRHGRASGSARGSCDAVPA